MVVKGKKTNKIAKKAVKKVSEVKSAPKKAKIVSSAPVKIVMPKRISIKPPEVVIVYGMRLDTKKITYTAVEAYNKKRYTVHDIRLSEFDINDPKFKSLMVKIAVLDRIEEEVMRLYPDATISRTNTVTLEIE